MAWMLDTHTLIWALFEPKKLGRRTRAILVDPVNQVFVSPISYWEISLKAGIGKLVLPSTEPDEIPAAAARLGLTDAPLPPEVLASFHRLPRAPDHRDPFDRLLIWHCIVGRITLLSQDRSLPFYQTHGLSFEW